MSEIVLLDTSIYMNVLDLPGLNQHRLAVLDEFARRVDAGDYFLLPLATVWETGNHIAGLKTGGLRRRYAQALADDVVRAIDGETPYRPTHFPTREEFTAWLREFPEFAQRDKSPRRTRAGVSLADTSLIKEWQRTCALHAMSGVLIWSLDADLQGYHQRPSPPRRKP
ncbi:MAG: hypothetical protein R3F39_25840 [Myxococcota bacterium]